MCVCRPRTHRSDDDVGRKFPFWKRLIVVAPGIAGQGRAGQVVACQDGCVGVCGDVAKPTPTAAASSGIINVSAESSKAEANGNELENNT